MNDLQRACTRLLAISSAAALAGCTLTLPMSGVVASSSETFVGRATGHMDGAGELQLTMNTGPTCTGRFVYLNGRQGSGVLNCSDGRAGSFDFVSTGSRGTGNGQIAGEPFTFVFGK